MSLTLSVVLMTLNGADRIPKCLVNLTDVCDQIVICVDDKSIDNSLEVAKSITSDAYPFTFKHWGQAKDNLLQYAKGDWIFLIDDDEDLTAEDAGNIKPACDTGFDMLIVPRYHWLDFERTVRDPSRPYPDGQNRLHQNVPYIRCGEQFAHASPRGYKSVGWVSPRIHINHYNAIYCSGEAVERKEAMYDRLYREYAGISYEEYLEQYVNSGKTADDFYSDLNRRRAETDAGGGI